MPGLTLMMTPPYDRQLRDSQVHLEPLIVITAGIVSNDEEGEVWLNLQKNFFRSQFDPSR